MANINRIREVLSEKGKSIAWLSDALGKDMLEVAMWCKNYSQPSIETFIEIARLLDVDIKELLASPSHNILPEDRDFPQLGSSIPAYRRALLRYKERYPNSHNEQKLLDELNTFLLDSPSVASAEEYRTFLQLYPEHPRKSSIVDRLNLANYIEQEKQTSTPKTTPKPQKRRRGDVALAIALAICILAVVIGVIGRMITKSAPNDNSAEPVDTIALEDYDEAYDYASGPDSMGEYQPNYAESYPVWNSTLPSDKTDEETRRYRYNQLHTGAKPYKSHYGEALTGGDYMKFKTQQGCDYVVIIKQASDDKYFNHVYIRGGEKATLYLPDGTYMVYFYSGKGWNPNKRKGHLNGGFIYSESTQKDGPVTLSSSYCEYTLYPVVDGNLTLDEADDSEVFN